MAKVVAVVDRGIKWIAYGMLALTVLVVLIALFSKDTEHEAGIGSFDSKSFDTGWVLEREDGRKEEITMPTVIAAEKGETLLIRNVLPHDLTDGSSLLARTAMENMYVYIGGALREQYTSEGNTGMAYYLPSAYVVTELSKEDAGQEILIRVDVKSRGVLNEVKLSHGNNAWFEVIKAGILVNAAAIIVLVLGGLLIITTYIMEYISSRTKVSLQLGFLMIDLAIWVLSESKLRQLIFARPSLSQYFAYFAVELLGVLACMYFDEVQHRRYHKRYVCIEMLNAVQIIVNVALHFAGIAEMHSTLRISHIWIVAAMLVAAANTFTDIRTGLVRKYKATVFGMLAFLVMAVIELLAYYTTDFQIYGISICIGLVVLAGANEVQILLDQVSTAREQNEKQTQMLVKTIGIIAGAIDAKDEYTGGHSERVGEYAAILAREMAADYDFTEDDIRRTHYIGTMHDIGKIGVADTVLNKSGRLTDAEFSLMKKHVEIGAEIMEEMGENIPDLLEGIRYHHERFDGRGYPEGLADTDIPLIARIICIADCYDAMTSNRIYRKRLNDEEVRAEFVRCAGTQFDPALVEIFVRLMDEGKIFPRTIEGRAVAENGSLMKAAVLEENLRKAMLSKDIRENSQEHLRMLSFLLKLKERKNESAEVFLVGLKKDGQENGKERAAECVQQVKKLLRTKDLMIECNHNAGVIALFDRQEAEIEAFTESLNAYSAHIFIERISNKS